MRHANLTIIVFEKNIFVVNMYSIHTIYCYNILMDEYGNQWTNHTNIEFISCCNYHGTFYVSFYIFFNEKT